MSDQYDDEDIILAELPDDELIEQMHDDLYDGLAEEVAEGTQILLDRGWEATRVLEEALVAGMTIVGIDFRDGILFVPEVLMAANSMKAGMAPVSYTHLTLPTNTNACRSRWGPYH